MRNADIEIFYGRATSTEAMVYVRSSPTESERPLTIIGGEVIGPSCQYTATLPASTPLVLLDEGDSLLARAVITDPSLWTPALPMIYRVRVEMRGDSSEVTNLDIELGIRHFGVKGTDFRLDGNRWVLRGVACSQMQPAALGELRETGTVLLISQPEPGLLEAALREGVILMLDLRDNNEIPAWIADYHPRWPAVSLTMIGRSIAAEPIRALLPNTTVVRWLEGDDTEEEAADADALGCRANHPLLLSGRWTELQKPLIVCRERKNVSEEIVVARRRCDTLQADLLPFGQFAGYVV